MYFIISHIELIRDSVSKLYKIRLNDSDRFLASTNSGKINLISAAGSGYYSNLWILTGDFDNITIQNASNNLSLVAGSDGKLALVDSSSPTAFKLEKLSLPNYGYTGDGYYTIQSAANENYYLGILNNTGKKGDNINLVTKNKALRVYISKASNDTFVIEDESRTRRLDMEGGSSFNGANVGAWDNNGNHCNQKWIIRQLADNSSKIFEICNKRALEIYGGTTVSGANIGVWDSHSGINQSWFVKRD